MKRPNGQSAGAGSLKPLKNCVFESADAENLRCKSWMADARRSWHVAKCWRISCLSFVTAQRARGFESVPGRARKSSSPLAIDLEQVLLADREAVRLLAACELNGTELRNCPAYIREWVTREGANKNASQGTGASEDSEDA